MLYLPHTSEDIASMLKTVGVDELDDLFSTVPEDCRFKGDLDLPEALTEWELNDHMKALSDNIAVSPGYKVFMGAGSYDHFIPASVSYLLSRSEFVTSYTPYQPEMSQGTLQAIYEYQTLAARLMGMEVATASHYDGAAALAEALLMAVRLTKRKRVAISSVIHPLYRRVVKTYFEPTGCEVIELPYLSTGVTDPAGLDSVDDLAAVAIQSPNFFGCIENLQAFGEKAHDRGALFVASFTEALAYGILKNPGTQGADIVAGEGQSLGIPRSFGGPGLGMLASRQKFMRSLPGRLVGQTKDLDGRRGFVLTLATREQHIRREKATSNICTNNSLCALAAAMYMASVGGTGIRELARLNYDKAEYLKAELKKAGFSVGFDSPTFNEFVVGFPPGFKATYERLLKKGIVAGLSLESYYPELADHYLLCVTETSSKEDMDALVSSLVL
ncbi:MAG: aminomethyl-transferring glycine dehydrogenase subunit GcvPA [Deltaproteobacteria bacterium]|nr:aminomethyl-transferring glycine dehydrogenase subunit GcvPA [Deltaproteobacteria bacterium]MBW2171232.1 aminomethyl-transferring glycine dehydrogenase subunit GcvPA [Deltaproteobacteria bacterium]